jgi:Xaa-Pro aminopeptidase
MENLTATFFIKNRYKLKELLLPSSVVVISSNRLMIRNGDHHYPFRQSSDLYYLTGIRQEMCTLVIYPEGGADKYKEVFFIPEGDKKTLVYEGPRITAQEVSETSGISDVRVSGNLSKDLGEILSGCRYIYFGTPDLLEKSIIPSNEMEIREALSAGISRLEEHMLAPLMTKIRMYKEPEEIDMMNRAISITGDAFIRVLQNLRPGMYEYQVAAHISYEFFIQGAREHAFEPIVASGKNGLVLHYVENRDVCDDGALLLMDFGADWEYYAADISRTIPVNGRYTRRQRELYDANLRVMQQALALMTPGKKLGEFNNEVGLLWEEEHVKLGLYSMRDVKKQSDGPPLWKRYYWHGTSHSIGLDVHDRFDPAVVFGPGMVLSCEPGIYIREEGVGIRLENDVLITGEGPVNLSENIPIDPDAIEVIMNKS